MSENILVVGEAPGHGFTIWLYPDATTLRVERYEGSFAPDMDKLKANMVYYLVRDAKRAASALGIKAQVEQPVMDQWPDKCMGVEVFNAES